MDANQALNGKGQSFTAREFDLIRELVKTRMEQQAKLEYEDFDGYELPPRTQFSMLKKPAVSIKYGQLIFNKACIRLFEGVKYILPIVHPGKKRMAVIACVEEESASVEWARQKNNEWFNKAITSLEFTENLFKLMNWDRMCRYKGLGRIAASERGIILVFDLAEAVIFQSQPEEFTNPQTGEVKKRRLKYYPDEYKDRIGKSYNDYYASRQLSLFEDLLDYIEQNGGAHSAAQGVSPEPVHMGFDGS
jgi:hypothetical protein